MQSPTNHVQLYCSTRVHIRHSTVVPVQSQCVFQRDLKIELGTLGVACILYSIVSYPPSHHLLPRLSSRKVCHSIMTVSASDDVCCCIDGSIWQRVGCIFTYSGSTIDVILNYSLVAINGIMCWMTLTLHTYHCTPDRSRALRNFALGAGIFGTSSCVCV